MPRIVVSKTRTIPAPASLVYDVVADYRSGHPAILPPEYFGPLEVLAGGRGEGTRIRFSMKAFGRVTVGEATISEPDPGRELRETLPGGIVTTFLVEPSGPAQCLTTITTEYAKSGLRGWVERLLGPAYLRRVFAAELAQLARVAAERRRPPLRPDAGTVGGNR